VIAANPELEGIDSIVWVEPDADGRTARVLTRSQAALRVARYLGGAWRLWLVFVVVPRPIRDWIYDLVARHRHRLMGTAEGCVIPPADARERFLDEDS
jgi:predicted DCC family thiol-disulfide oxidoreductase YuxK